MRLAHALYVAFAALLFAAPTLTRAEATEASVVCKDGTTSKGGKGACSGHGGVNKDATQASAQSSGPAAAPSGGEATVTCKDGTTSKGGKGACSGHGGVNKDAAKAQGKQAAPAAPPAPATSTAPAPAPTTAPSAKSPAASTATAPTNAKNTDPTGAIAKCKDGTYSHSKGHEGACSHHGGVAEWLDKPAK